MDPTVLRMAILRILFGSVSIIGALFMFYFNRVEHALKVNAVIGSIGPFVFLTISGIGLVGISGQVEVYKIIMIISGIGLILFGTR